MPPEHAKIPHSPDKGVAVTRRRLLVMEDKPDEVKGLVENLSGRYDIDIANTPESALLQLATRQYHLLMADLFFDDKVVTTRFSGLEAIELVRQRHPQLPILAISGTADGDDAAQALALGAFHFVSKRRAHPETVANLIEKAIANANYEEQLEYHRSVARRVKGDVVYRCRAMQDVIELAEAYALKDEPILITGENGTGKDLLARVIHDASGRRGPWRHESAPNLEEGVFDAEFFGTEPGAFTGAVSKKGLLEQAEGGTLFLNEIAAIPPRIQQKFLTVLEQRRVRRLGGTKDLPVNVRLVFATNEDLDAMAHAGSLRVDLYYRVNQLRIHVPPLRGRENDVLDLARHFLALKGLKSWRLASESAQLLLEYSWPGNVRQLNSVIRTLAALPARLLPADGVILPHHLYAAGLPRSDDPSMPLAALHSPPPDDLRRLEALPVWRLLPFEAGKQQVTDAFRRRTWAYARAKEGDNMTAVAKLLGVSRMTAHDWRREFEPGAPEDGRTEGDSLQ